jgi:hypothetical protein
VAEAGVPRAAAAVVLAPRDRVVAHRAAAVARLVEAGENAHVRPRVGAVVVPLVDAGPGLRQVRRRRVATVFDPDPRRLVGRVRLEVGADQAAVPGPVVLGVGGRVDADVPTARGDVGLEGVLLGGVEHVAGGRQPHHRLVPGQVRRREVVRVLGGGHREPVGAAELADRVDPRRYRVVPEAGGLREHQHVCQRPGRFHRRRRHGDGSGSGGECQCGGRNASPHAFLLRNQGKVQFWAPVPLQS